MTEINQNSFASHHSVDESSRHHEDGHKGTSVSGRQLVESSPRDLKQDSTTGSVNISFNAHMRLRAYQDQKVALSANEATQNLNLNHLTTELVEENQLLNNTSEKNHVPTNAFSQNNYSPNMRGMLSEIQKNIVQSSEPGYRYLENLLNNHKGAVEDPQQLQEIMRKEEFYLSKRKPFMESGDFQSYSQVLSQFSNVIARQQYS